MTDLLADQSVLIAGGSAGIGKSAELLFPRRRECRHYRPPAT
ncbi:hypothetical protein [Promicromonospora sp. NPDC050249]